MKKTHFARRVLVGFAIAMLIGGNVPAFAQKRETVILAMLNSSAEGDQDSSRHALQGAQLAVELVNGAGGILGPTKAGSGTATPTSTRRDTVYTFTLQTRTAATQTEMRTAIQASIDAKPAAILGPNIASLANNNLDLVNTARIPIFLNTSTEPTGSTNQYIFRMRAYEDALARDAANYLTQTRFFRSIATAADNSERGADGVAEFERAARAAVSGSTTDLISESIRYDDTATDLNSQAQELYDANPQAVAVFGTAETAAALITALKSKGYQGVIVYGSAEGNLATFLERAGTATADVLIPLIWSPEAVDSGSQRFTEAYRVRFGELPTAAAVVAFDSVAAIAASIKINGGSPETIRNTLASTTATGGVQGVYNPTFFGNGRTIEASIFFRLTSAGDLLEEVRYNSGFCARNCADTNFQNITDSSISPLTASMVMVVPQSGLAGEIGEQALRGAQLAINEINSAGGVFGPSNTRFTLDLRSFDTGTADEIGVTLRTVLPLQPAAILGPTLTGLALPNLNAAPNAKVPQFLTGTALTLTASDPTRYTFQLRPTDGTSATALASYLVDIRGFTRYAVAASTTSYGQDSVAAFTGIISRFKDLTGAQIVASTSHAVTATDFTAEAQTLLAQNPQVIAIWSAPTTAAGLVKALKAAGYSGVIVTDGITNQEFTAQFKPEELKGMIGAASWIPSAIDAASERFVEAYRATYGEMPDSYAVAYYDAVYMVANAIKVAGPLPVGIQAFVTRAPRFVGVQGEYRPAVLNNGQLTAQVFLVQADADGSVREIARYESAICINGCY